MHYTPASSASRFLLGPSLASSKVLAQLYLQLMFAHEHHRHKINCKVVFTVVFSVLLLVLLFPVSINKLESKLVYVQE